MKAFLLAAGRGTRFLPVTELLPKPLFPFLNVPLARAQLLRLAAAGVQEAGLNLHHRGGQIVRELSRQMGKPGDRIGWQLVSIDTAKPLAITDEAAALDRSQEKSR